MRMRNTSLLAKWLWQFYHEVDILWQKVIVKKHESHLFEWIGVGLKDTFKNLWKVMVANIPLLS